MLHDKYFIALIITIAFSPMELDAQKWKNSLKNISKKVAKDVVKEIKPLSVDFKVSKINYNPFKSINKLTLTIDFDCENPNPLGVTFNKTEFELLVNEKLVSKFYNEKKISIPKKNKFSFQEKAEINLAESGKTIFDAMIKKEAVYTIIGKYYVDTSLGTFSFKVKLIEKEVNKTLKSTKSDPATLPKTK